ncbi:MAG: hypothetical protein ACYC8T_07715 [Myxococcaceae bacterium]
MRSAFAALLLLSTSALAQDPDERLPFSYNFGGNEREVVGTGSVTVTAVNGGSGPGFGYYPLRISLDNSATHPQEVRLTFTGLSGGSGRPVTRTVKLERGEKRTVILPVPVTASYRELRAASPGITQGGRKAIHFSSVSRPYKAVLALGTPDEFQVLVGEAPTYSAPTVTVTTLPPDEAPEELAAYTGFDEVVVTRLPPDELSEARRRALEAYAATGGTLFLGRSTRAVTTYFPLLDGDAAGLHDYGFGHLHLCAADCGPGVKAGLDLPKLPVRPKGPPPAWARRSFGYNAYDSLGGEADPDGMMLPQATAPVGRFLIIIVLFTLAIGPGSIFVARRKGPAALLITIPLTAAVTCAAIVGYSVLKEGFAVHASTRGFTLLDRAHQRAVTVGLGAFYANLAPGEARFSATTALISPDGRQSEAQQASLDWTQGARFGSDFLPARAYREWGVLSVDPSRARLTVRRVGDGLEVQNALGSDLRAAHFRLDGKDWRVENVPDGGAKKAQVREKAVPLPGVEVKDYAGRFDPVVAKIAKAPLKEGQFLAQVQGPSLMPVGGLRLSLHSAEHLIRGEVDR